MSRAALAQERKAHGWADDALDVIRLVAEQQRTVHVDDVAQAALELGLQTPEHPNAWGSVWRVAVLRGFITRTGEVRGAGTKFEAHKHKHSRAYPVYRSNLFRGPVLSPRSAGPHPDQSTLLVL
jgi:hypothetical protein